MRKNSVALGISKKRIWAAAAVCLSCVLVSAASAVSPKLQLTNELGMVFNLVKPGVFTMGSPVSEPFRGKGETRRKVVLEKAFYLMETEVTLGWWRAVMGRRWINPRKGAADLPVVQVSYFDCLKFIDKLNQKGPGKYRLPTSAEWEYACRAGATTAYSFGPDIDCSLAMYGNNSVKQPECIEYVRSMGLPADSPAPVKTYPPNAWGFYDMHGNVWEWCSDAKEDMHVKRGGSWFKYGYSCRSANEALARPGARFRTTGFRLVMEVP